MNSVDCVAARRQLALWVGGDLSEQQQKSLDHHLEHCDECSQVAAAQTEAHTALESCRDSALELESSLWPAIQRSLPRRHSPAQRLTRFWARWVIATSLLLSVAVLLKPEGAQPIAENPEPAQIPRISIGPDYYRSGSARFVDGPTSQDGFYRLPMSELAAGNQDF